MNAPSAHRRPVRLLAIHTHPVQYYAPLFRTLTDHCPDIQFEALYLTRPTAKQQGQGFGVAFQWDQDLLDGYRWRVFRDPLPRDDYAAWGALDAPGIGRTIEDARPDVVLLPGWNCRGLLRALLACNRLKIPVLYRGDTSLWQRPAGLAGIAWSLKNRFLLSRFSGFLAVGKRARIFLREHGVPETRIVDSPHAVDGERIRRDAGDAMTPEGAARVREELGLRKDDFMVLFAGKLEPRKRPEDAIRAVAALGESAVLVVCGSGELEDSCRKSARDTGARVAWLGFRNQGELPRLYASASSLVLPSEWGETWGLVVNEAMAVGTPCVVSDAVGCAPDLVDPGLTGEVFPATSVSSLVEGLQRIRSLDGRDGSLRLRVRAREERYSLYAAARGIEKLAKTAVQVGPEVPQITQSRVVALCDGMAFLGGMERRTMEILGYASAGGADVHCIINPQPWFRYRIAQRVEQGGHSWSTTRAKGMIFGGERSARWLCQVVGDLLVSSERVLAAAVRRRANIVFLWSFASAIRNWPALFALRWSGSKIVLRSGSTPALGARQRWIWRWVVDSVVDIHVANCTFIASEIAATGIQRAKIRVIRNPLPEEKITSTPSTPSTPRIVYVGQVLPEKGIVEFLDALYLLDQREIRFEAVLVGRFDGWEHPSHRGYKSTVRTKIATLPEGAVRVLGEREDVLDLMCSSSVHCCPSQERQREGVANVVLQAKAAGIPSVVTPSGALPEMVRHGLDGWVCRGFGPEAIAEGLAHFLTDTEACRRAGLEAATWRDPAYLSENVQRQWRELLCGTNQSSDPVGKGHSKPLGQNPATFE